MCPNKNESVTRSAKITHTTHCCALLLDRGEATLGGSEGAGDPALTAAQLLPLSRFDASARGGLGFEAATPPGSSKSHRSACERTSVETIRVNNTSAAAAPAIVFIETDGLLPFASKPRFPMIHRATPANEARVASAADREVENLKRR